MSDNKITLQHETHRQLARRQGVSVKTLDRWIDLGILPEPLRVRGRKYHVAGIEPRRDAGKRSKPVGRAAAVTSTAPSPEAS